MKYTFTYARLFPLSSVICPMTEIFFCPKIIEMEIKIKKEYS